MIINTFEQTNILGLQQFQLKPGKKLTLVSGQNGKGKTSLVRALTFALKGGSGVLRNGESEAEACVILDSGIQIRRGSSELKKIEPVIQHPQFGKLKKPGENIRKLVDEVALDIDDFLRGKPQERLKTVLESFPMELTLQEVAEYTHQPLDIVEEAVAGIEGAHALTLLEKIEKKWMEDRKVSSGIAEDKEATLRQFADMTTDDDGVDYVVLVAGLQKEQQTLIEDRAEEVNAIRSGAAKRTERVRSRLRELSADVLADRTKRAQAASSARLRAIEEAKRVYDASVQAAEAALHQETQAATRDAEIKLEEIQKSIQVELDAIDKQTSEDLALVQAAPEERLRAISEELGSLNAKAEASQRNRAMAEMKKKLAEGRDLALANYANLDEAINAIRDLRAKLVLDRTTMPGLSVMNGDIAVDGVAWATLNTQAKLEFFVRLVTERAKRFGFELPVVFIDGIECLDPIHLESFIEWANGPGNQTQIIATRVSGDAELTVRTFDGGE